MPTTSATDGLVLETAKKSPFQITVTEKGTLDSMRNASLTSKVEGTTTIISIVPEGTQVKEGDIVCELDASTLIDKETAQEILVVKAKALLLQADEDLAIQKTQNESDQAAAELKRDLAKLDLDKFNKGDFLQLVADIEAEKSLAEGNLTKFQESCIFIRRLVQKGYKNQNDLEAEELNLNDAMFKLKSAQTKLNVLENYTKERTLKELEANVTESGREIDRIKRKGLAALAQFEAEHKSRDLTYDVESKKLDRLKAQIEACKIKATQDGQVVYANTRDGRSSDQVLIEVGGTVRERQPIINLPDLDSMKVNARIHESRISLVRTGLAAKIKVDAYADVTFYGEVDAVASVPSSTSSFNREIKEYEAVIKILDDPEKVNKLRPGLTATIEVLVERRDNILQIPVQAVVTVGAKQFVFVVSGKSVGRKAITIGQTNERMIEIVSGLNEGDQVVMNPRSHFNKEIAELEAEQASLQSKVSEENQSKAVERMQNKSPSSDSPSGSPSAQGGKPATDAPAGQGRPKGAPSEGGRPPFDPVARFKSLDKNGDGKIAKDEADERMLSRFDTMDGDRDGSISQDEWTASMAKFRGGGGQRPPTGDSGGS
ncbi:MAG: efflux RND transporter periplasmic adaptor subunit [Candidatus Saccharimonas sp.]|nr:efflux RND transporter periplasmic adaptor subunit [Planctomycetaceae bacterium]